MDIRMLKVGEQPPWHLLLQADPSKDLVSGYLDKGSCYVMESECSDTIGVILLVPVSSHIIEIMNLAVDELHQGKGLGTILLKHGIQTAAEKGYSMVEIGTGNSSIFQLALYQKVGFRITGIDRDFFIRNYQEPIFENGIQCRDMIRLSMLLNGENRFLE
ncbi:GNAT family N-acetyltransferase [Mesobacillus subterraneus]|uniref:GNAT family N-acetyltransferase n=1 Tax=Mesobacillus subterraneus TaxID=285983 RepID=UPI001CFE5D99|nr:GNAT family N-acetyltransferase [Mesobacillus subterraneus]WLR56854.1 GNAT family N-acetyltransferase [Mesobacillus subterraneus]